MAWQSRSDSMDPRNLQQFIPEGQWLRCTLSNSKNAAVIGAANHWLPSRAVSHVAFKIAYKLLAILLCLDLTQMSPLVPGAIHEGSWPLFPVCGSSWRQGELLSKWPSVHISESLVCWWLLVVNQFFKGVTSEEVSWIVEILVMIVSAWPETATAATALRPLVWHTTCPCTRYTLFHAVWEALLWGITVIKDQTSVYGKPLKKGS